MIWYKKGRGAGSFHLIYNKKLYTYSITSNLEVGEINPLEMDSFSQVNAISIIESNGVCFLGLEYNNVFKEYSISVAPQSAVQSIFMHGGFLDFISRGIHEGDVVGVQALFVYSQCFNILPILAKLGITNLTNV